MTAPGPPNEMPRPQIVQRNERDGIFVGRDMHGDIIQHLDDATKEVLKKLSHEAPSLARLLRKALQDGIVSPGVVYALEFAARSINEDIALMLSSASQGINEDVASMLQSAAHDLREVTNNGTAGLDAAASRVSATVQTLQGMAEALAEVSNPHEGGGILGRLNTTLSEMRLQADRMEGVVTPPPAQVVVNWKPTFWAFIWGMAAGLMLMAYIVNR